MKPGDRVLTPHGPARIVSIDDHTRWTFGRARRQPLVIVQYPAGNRQAWVANKVRPYDQTTTKKGDSMTTYQPEEAQPETTEEQPAEEPNPDQTQLEPDPPETDEETEEEQESKPEGEL